MRVAVFGVGPIGALMAAALARAGQRPLLIDVLPSRLVPVRGRGLLVTGPGVPYRAHPDTAPLHEVARGVDVAFLDVPHRITSAACEALRRLLAPGGTVVSLQHGLHAQWVAELVGVERAVVVCPGFDVALSTPTDVAHGAGRVVAGTVGGAAASHLLVITDLLARAGFEVAPAPDVRPHLWSATIVTALTAASATDGLADDDLVALAREFAGLAAAYGVEIEPKEGLDLTAFAPGSPPESAPAALRAWRRVEPDRERAGWLRRLDGLALTSALAERIGYPLSVVGRMLIDASAAGDAVARAPRSPRVRV